MKIVKMVSKILPIVVTTSIVAIISTGVCVYLVRKKKRQNRIPTEWKKIGNTKKLFIFPLKSGHYMEIDSAECTVVGLSLLKDAKNPLELRDRSFIVYGEKDGEVKSGKPFPQLVKIEVSVHDGNHIALDAPQMRTLYVRIPERDDSNIKTVKFWSGEPIEAIDCGDEAARWLSHHLSQKDNGYRLGYHDASKRRNLVKFQDRMKYYKLMTDAATGLFSDVTSVLVLNQASVNDYNKKAPSANVTPLNFRPNIIVDDPDIKPYEEDDWDWLKIGDDVIMRNVKECTRCVFTTVDQETGVRNSDREPLNTLSQYRMSKSPENMPIMGIHMEVKQVGIIRCGDPVYIGKN
ncbi:mitochondrial amidoxime-reducing component 1-like [Harmonia axyridis]|uniref:mitochondrial amidoxime-reducing component 1-like n=1 Tax=Harmonia axyridis TaxID=115357 RepID=UPI001E27676A|nr:mitochondrial amidoxime-reducing component 1-like [Harmonia axyridis]